MSVKDHQSTDWGNGGIRCIWCHEPWPCPTVELAAEVRRGIAEEVRPNKPEPLCCDLHAATWQERMDIAEEIEDKVPQAGKEGRR